MCVLSCVSVCWCLQGSYRASSALNWDAYEAAPTNDALTHLVCRDLAHLVGKVIKHTPRFVTLERAVENHKEQLAELIPQMKAKEAALQRAQAKITRLEAQLYGQPQHAPHASQHAPHGQHGGAYGQHAAQHWQHGGAYGGQGAGRVPAYNGGNGQHGQQAGVYGQRTGMYKQPGSNKYVRPQQ